MSITPTNQTEKDRSHGFIRERCLRSAAPTEPIEALSIQCIAVLSFVAFLFGAVTALWLSGG